MSVIRTATYIATREHIRVDRKTRGTVKCTAGNKKCGNRCIPRDWDCRLQGQGGDSHLKAVGRGSDPLAGIANIQRGLGRIGRGLTKLNFSELEGGRKAVIRGVVKGSPGDIQKKEEIRSTLIQGTVVLGALGALTVGGVRVHGLLMNTNVYRNNIGDKLENGMRKSLDGLLDNTPFIGASRERVRQGAGEVLQRRIRLQNRTPEPEDLFGSLSRKQDIEAFKTSLRKGPVKIDVQEGALTVKRKESFAQFHKRSVKEFFSTSANEEGLKVTGKGRRPLLSKDSTENFMRDFYQIPKNLKGKSANKYAEEVISKEAKRLRALADQMGVDRNSQVAMRAFADKYAAGQDEQMILDIVDMLDPKFNPAAQYTALRKRVRETYDTFYRDVSTKFKPVYKANGERTGNIRVRDPFTAQAVEEHAKLLAREFYGDASRVKGPFTGDMALHHFYQVDGNKKALLGVAREWTAPDTVIRRAAKEISGRNPKDIQAALAVVRSNGFPDVDVYQPLTKQKLEVPVGSAASKTTSIEVNLPQSPERKYPGWAEDNIEEFTKLRLRFMAKARKTLRRPGGPTPEEEDVRKLAMTWMEQAGWLTPEPRGDSSPRSDTYQRAFLETLHSLRNDKKCGESGIAPHKKCSKRTNNSTATIPTKSGPAAVQRSAARAPKQEDDKNSNVKRNVAIGAAVVGATAVATVLGVKRQKVIAYRQNVTRSAEVAETMAKQLEMDMKVKAASRLGKRVEEVTGFEASTYDFKDRGRDTGWTTHDDNTPHFFGQTKKSKGAVVVLSFADDNLTTSRGQGAYVMATKGKGGVFNSIWGEHDLLPFANSISQKKAGGTDGIDLQRRSKTAERLGKVVKKVPGVTAEAAEAVEKGAKDLLGLPKMWKDFKFLRDNVESRGYNPDAVRAAAFVAAQRRLTGKPVNIVSYSNGGNVAVETLKILEEMGYRDVKVLNVAGPTFGMFKHSRENLRTWVSKGDMYHQMSKGQAFAGGNTKILDNDNIPHGLDEAINPNNKAYKDHSAQRRARNSYMLDEQLQKEAYRFLTIDSLRARQLQNDFVYSVVEDREIEGHLGYLIGDKGKELKARFQTTLKAKGKEAAKDEVLDTIEEAMIEKWYGGYSPAKVKKAQQDIRAELESSLDAPQPAPPPEPSPRANSRRPVARSESVAIASMLRMKNPDGSPKYPNRRSAKAAYDRMKARRSSKSAA